MWYAIQKEKRISGFKIDIVEDWSSGKSRCIFSVLKSTDQKSLTFKSDLKAG